VVRVAGGWVVRVAGGLSGEGSRWMMWRGLQVGEW
jgi:hypothetical protein